MPRRLLILGNSAAALAAAGAIRARGGGERITMVSREQCSACLLYTSDAADE